MNRIGFLVVLFLVGACVPDRHSHFENSETFSGVYIVKIDMNSVALYSDVEAAKQYAASGVDYHIYLVDDFAHLYVSQYDMQVRRCDGDVYHFELVRREERFAVASAHCVEDSEFDLDVCGVCLDYVAED